MSSPLVPGISPLISARLLSEGGSGTGATGPQGPAGPAGPAGPQNLYVQDTQPAFSEASLWIDTSGGNISFWVYQP